MAVIATFTLLFIAWIIMSGRFDPFHLGLGLLSCLLVAFLSADLLFTTKKRPGSRCREALRFCRYTVWLLGQIVLANLHVIRLAFSPGPVTGRLDPQLISFRTRLQTDFARFVLANSITLTPGTVTVRLDGATFLVHAISHQAAGDLPGAAVSEMERRVAWVFEGGTL